jgi:hypothetical protein
MFVMYLGMNISQILNIIVITSSDYEEIDCTLNMVASDLIVLCEQVARGFPSVVCVQNLNTMFSQTAQF